MPKRTDPAAPSSAESVALSNPGAPAAAVANVAGDKPDADMLAELNADPPSQAKPASAASTPEDKDSTGAPTDAQMRKVGAGPNSQPNGAGNPVPDLGKPEDVAAANADLAAAAKRTGAKPQTLEGLASPQPLFGSGDDSEEIDAPALGRIVHVTAQHPTRGLQTFAASVTMTTPGSSKINAAPILDGSNQEGHGHQYSIEHKAVAGEGQASWSWPERSTAKIRVPRARKG